MGQITSVNKIEVTVNGGCHNCPFKDSNGICNLDMNTRILSGYPSSCELIDKKVYVERKK